MTEKPQRTYIDIHALQTVPPSNLNRDDTGSPKTAIYGGVRRARVSSQAWKKATRDAFPSMLDSRELGVRTLHVVDLIAESIAEQAPDLAEQSHDIAQKVLEAIGIKLTKPRKTKDGEESESVSGYLIFLSNLQVKNLARLACESSRSGEPLDKKALKAAADTSHSVDVALFGRMIADAADLNVDAAAQVAHAISVHPVDNEFDYFTAIDDRSPEDNAGAGMIGTVEFNSSTLYRYATVNVGHLRENLGTSEATTAAVSAFLRSFLTSMPSGKQNTFANRTLPDGIIVTIRDDQPVNLSGAFEEAITATTSGKRLAHASARLATRVREIDAAYGEHRIATLVVRVGEATAGLAETGQEASLDGMIDRVAETIAERLG